MRHVVIVSSERSGEALVAGVLNTLDGWHVKGRNDGFVFDLYKAFRALGEARAAHVRGSQTLLDAWYGIGDLKPREARGEVGRLIERFLLGSFDRDRVEVLGFTETVCDRLAGEGRPEPALGGYLKFLADCLSHCRFVFLTDTDGAGWLSGFGAASRKRKFRRFSQRYCRDHPDAAFRIDRADLAAGSARLGELFDFLGVTPDPLRLAAVLATPHGEAGRGASADPERGNSPRRSDRLRLADEYFLFGKEEEARAIYREILDDRRENGGYRPERALARTGHAVVDIRSSPAHRLVYFSIPKSACTTISHIIYELREGRPCEGDVHLAFDDLRTGDELAEFDEFHKFTVVRDPVERFVSAYRNRVLHHRELEAEANQIRRLPYDSDISTVALNVEFYRRANTSLFHHFERQAVRVGGTLDTLDAVYPIERLDDMVEDLSKRVGRPLVAGRYETGGPNVTRDDLTKEAVAHLNEYYAEDYELLRDFYRPQP